MDQSYVHPNCDILERFTSLQALSRNQQETLCGRIRIQTAKSGTTLIEQGSEENFSLFLVEGRLLLEASDGKRNEVVAGDNASRSPIAQLRPRRYEVTTLSPVKFLKIDNSLLEEVASKVPVPEQLQGYMVRGETKNSASGLENQIATRFLSDLEQDELVLPTLPEVAARIGQALRDDTSDAVKIAELIQTDPAITVKLIKAANSALYGRRTPVETCAAAVVRLGTDVTHKLVLSYAMQDLFRSESGLLQSMMTELWRHSVKVAAICHVLARQDSRFNPEQAMLVGLLHDIGVVAVINYTRNFSFEVKKRYVIEEAIKHLRAQIGGMILNKWGFSSDFVTAALEGEEWMRDTPTAPDYCDLVIIAQLHSFIGTDKMISMPAIDDVPAHRRLNLGPLTPLMSLEILDQAEEQIAHTESMLNF